MDLLVVGLSVGLAAVGLGGCTQILGIEELSPGSSPDASTSAPDARRVPDAAAGLIDARPIDAGLPDASAGLACADQNLGSVLGLTAFETDPAGDDVAASCGGAGSPDLLMSWTAPVSDYYVLDTFDANFDTVLAVYDECSGNELVCSNNVDQRVQSEIVHRFEQGQQVLVQVDGAAGDSGRGNLRIERVQCPDADLTGQSFPLELSIQSFGDDLSTTCGGAGQEDRAYHWTAPEDGLYYVRAFAETFRPVVALVDGTRCGDANLGCNAAATPQFGAEVVRFLRAGQEVSILVDGVNGAGLFTLDVGRHDGPACPETVLTANTGTLLDDFTPRSLAPSCDFARRGGAFGGTYDVPDKTYSLRVPGDGGDCFGTCSIQATASQGLVLYVLDGDDCGGAEVDCVVGSDPDADGVTTASISISADPQDHTYTVVVADRFDSDGGGGFQLSADCFIACP
ncbi:hypothetical protein [Haliangium sp.]|uniref:hypothetical protein n=1 Tax=Haliangium sp. TaxID=2663208 RepID=UPI003D103D65